jgi:uncharacterized protein YkwD
VISTPDPARRWLAVAGLALALAGCAAIEANRRIPGVVAAGSFSPARPPSPRLGPDPTRACPEGGPYTETSNAVEKGVAERGANPAKADGQLCAIAEAFLGWTDAAPPREAVRTFVARHFGVVSAPQVSINVLESEDSRIIGQSLASTVLQYANQVSTPRYGLAVERISKGKSRAVMVFDSPRVALEPLPRGLEPDQKATVSGVVLGDLENPKLLISDTQGVLRELPQPAGRAFKGEIACGPRSGRILVEIRAEDMGNETVAATLAVACGGPALPTSVAVAAPPWPDAVAEQEARIARVIDGERAEGGLAAVTWSEPVGRVAREVSESLRDGARKGGVAAPVNVAQRLADADIQAQVILQNPAAGPTAEGANERLLASPSHRATVMTTEATTGGIGVALGTDKAGRPMAYLTQLFVKVQAPPDVAVARQTIREAIDKKRASEKLDKLTPDPVLEKLAGEYAAVVAGAGGPPPKAKTDELVKTLRKGFKDIVFLVDSRIDLADFAEDPNALAKAKLVGLGAAVGSHPRLGKNTLFVVLIIGNKLPGAK